MISSVLYDNKLNILGIWFIGCSKQDIKAGPLGECAEHFILFIDQLINQKEKKNADWSAMKWYSVVALVWLILFDLCQHGVNRIVMHTKSPMKL